MACLRKLQETLIFYYRENETRCHWFLIWNSNSIPTCNICDKNCIFINRFKTATLVKTLIDDFICCICTFGHLRFDSSLVGMRGEETRICFGGRVTCLTLPCIALHWGRLWFLQARCIWVKSQAAQHVTICCYVLQCKLGIWCSVGVQGGFRHLMNKSSNKCILQNLLFHNAVLNVFQILSRFGNILNVKWLAWSIDRVWNVFYWGRN